MKELLENQRALNAEIQRTSAAQEATAAGISGIETRVNDLPGQIATTAADTITANETASTTLADRLTQATVENAAAIRLTLDALPTAVAAAAPWWKLPAQALGLTGPLGAAAVAITWLLARRARAAAHHPPVVVPEPAREPSPERHDTSADRRTDTHTHTTRVEKQPRYVRVESTDHLGESYKEAINRECELQGDRFRPIADRLHATATAIAHGRDVSVRTDVSPQTGIGWQDKE